jgi:hypothetical protein
MRAHYRHALTHSFLSRVRSSGVVGGLEFALIYQWLDTPNLCGLEVGGSGKFLAFTLTYQLLGTYRFSRGSGVGGQRSFNDVGK